MAWYVILLLILAGVLLAREGRSQKQEKSEEDFPALSWIREQEQEDVKEIEKKLNAKEQAEQIKDPAKLDKGSLKERFRNAVLVGDSVATGFLDYEILDSTSIVALRGLRTDTAGPEIEPVRRVKSMLGVTRPRASLLKEGFPGGVAVRVMRGGRDSPGRFRSGRRIYPE